MLLARWGVVILFLPVLLSGQELARKALSTFPADTQQLTYSNLAQLHALPGYSQIHQKLLNRQLRDFEDFLRSMGIDPAKDVDEVVLGWRGQQAGASGFFGLAEGRFQPQKVRDFFAQSQLPHREYAGSDLYAFGSGEDRADLFFTFLGSSSAAFGRAGDLKALLDVRAGTAPALDSNSAFVSWEAELEGSAPQWGVASGKAAAGQAAPWVSSAAKVSVDPSALLGLIQAALYRVDWGSGFTAHLSILCQNQETAAGLAQVLTLWQASPQAVAASPSPAIAAFLQGMEIRASGSRVELTGSGPIEAFDQFFRESAQTP